MGGDRWGQMGNRKSGQTEPARAAAAPLPDAVMGGEVRLSRDDKTAVLEALAYEDRALRAAATWAVVEGIVAAQLAPVEALAERHVGEDHGCLSPEMHGYGCHQCWADELRAALGGAAAGEAGE